MQGTSLFIADAGTLQAMFDACMGVSPSIDSKEMTMKIATVGIDLAKNVFAVHAVGKGGLVELKRSEVRRAKLLGLVASWPPCLIGMETCSGAHHWAREFEKLGHTVRLMAPKFVAPYRMAGTRGKNDANDAQAICEDSRAHPASA
jgi:transposase